MSCSALDLSAPNGSPIGSSRFSGCLSVATVEIAEFSAQRGQFTSQLLRGEHFDRSSPPSRLLGQRDDEIGPHLGGRHLPAGLQEDNESDAPVCTHS
jgi:hypothetical protein